VRGAHPRIGSLFQNRAQKESPMTMQLIPTTEIMSESAGRIKVNTCDLATFLADPDYRELTEEERAASVPEPPPPVATTEATRTEAPASEDPAHDAASALYKKMIEEGKSEDEAARAANELFTSLKHTTSGGSNPGDREMDDEGGE
jgi:hypothetical protein